MSITFTVLVTIELNKNECAIEKHRVVQLSSTSKMNLISFKTDQKLTQNNQYQPKFQPLPPGKILITL